MGEYIDFIPDGPSESGKTERFSIISKNNLHTLATVRWYGPWRQYCIFFNSDTIFNLECLTDVINFLNSLNKKHGMKKHG